MSIESEIIKFQTKLGKFECNIKLTPPKNDILALTGKSGSGKSTLAKVLCGLIKPKSGKIVINNRTIFNSQKNINLPPHLRNIGMVFQEHRLFLHMSVKSNLLYGQKMKKLNNNKLYNKTVKILDLQKLLDRKVSNLSGGEAQRVSIGRAILSEPELLILDEPLSSLDVERRRSILSVIKDINKKSKIPIIFISHSINEIALAANSIAIIESGKIKIQGAVNDVLNNKFSRISNIENDDSVIIECKIKQQNINDNYTKVVANSTEIIISKITGKIGTKIILRLFAKDISIAITKPKNISINNIFKGIVTDIYESNIIGNTYVELDVDGNIILARVLQSSIKRLNIKINNKVYALIKSISVVG